MEKPSMTSRSSSTFLSIINFLPDATFAVELNGRMISWNRLIEEMTGVKAEDIIGKGDYSVQNKSKPK